MNWHELFHTLEVNFILLFSLSVVGWIFYLVKKKAFIFDMLWATGCMIATTCAFATLHGYIWRRLAVFVMVLVWSSRLLFYFYGQLLQNNEEGSLSRLQYVLGLNSFIKKAFLFVCQQIIVQIAIWPVLLICSNSEPKFSVLEYMAIGLFFFSIVGEGYTHKKLCELKTKPENHEKHCQNELWRYFCNPNRIFAWTAWFALFLFACTAPFGFTAMISPICMWYVYSNSR